MITYIEKYVILGTEFGIEDYEDGQPLEKHFFGHEYKEGRTKRYRLWRGGGGFGQEHTIEAAREKLFSYALDIVQKKKKDAIKTLVDCENAIKNIEANTE